MQTGSEEGNKGKRNKALLKKEAECSCFSKIDDGADKELAIATENRHPRNRNSAASNASSLSGVNYGANKTLTRIQKRDRLPPKVSHPKQSPRQEAEGIIKATGTARREVMRQNWKTDSGR